MAQGGASRVPSPGASCKPAVRVLPHHCKDVPRGRKWGAATRSHPDQRQGREVGRQRVRGLSPAAKWEGLQKDERVSGGPKESIGVSYGNGGRGGGLGFAEKHQGRGDHLEGGSH